MKILIKDWNLNKGNNMKHTVSNEMIPGVSIIPLINHVDERGYLMELLNINSTFFDKDKLPFAHSYITTSRPGIIKAWHMHEEQYDRIAVIKGTAKIALHDMGHNKSNLTNEFIVSPLNNMMILIPPYVAHGWMNVGNEELIMINFSTKVYDNKKPDEIRYSFDNEEFGYDWNIKHR